MKEELHKIIKSLKEIGLTDENVIQAVKGILKMEGGRNNVENSEFE